ncbi:MAG TPA: VTT domain-containing protein [Nevskiaceae bacterium]|nr:VTT domain-containing protein [Nevskiaceae bacterium]
MLEWLQTFTAWAQAHKELALALVFLVSFFDCLFVVGLFLVFAAVFLFGTGALIAMGAFDFWPTILIVACGGVLGDTVSYFIGRHYGVALFKRPFFAKRPGLVERGRVFFGRHGGKGLVVAHNVGVLRPLLPAMAGAYGLSLPRFALAIVPAALSWALVYIVPGVAVGASMGLAAEVTRRLAILIVGLGATLWLALWLTSLFVRLMQARAQQFINAMLELSRRNRTLGQFGPDLADPAQPETPALALFATVLVVIGGITLLLLWGFDTHAQPPAYDLAVYQSLRSIEEPWATALAVFFSLLGEWPVYLPYAAAAAMMLTWMRSDRAVQHWLAALSFGLVIMLGLSLLPNISNPLEYMGLASSAHFPRDLVMAAVIYGFTPVLLGGAREPGARVAIYGAMFALLLLIMLARLYLGTLWLSVGLTAVLTTLLFVAALGLGYRQRGVEKVSLRRFWPALVVLLLAATLHERMDFAARKLEHTPAPVLKSLDAQRWWERDWLKLRARRQDVAGRDKQLLNLQWAGDLTAIRAAMLQQGWQDPEELSFATALRWLSLTSPIKDLPMLPRYHAGRHEVLRLRRDIDDDHQYSLRLWPSGHVLDNGQNVWTGTLIQQEVRVVFKIFRYPSNEDAYTPSLDALTLPLPGFETRRVMRQPAGFATLLLRPAEDSHVPEQ